MKSKKLKYLPQTILVAAVILMAVCFSVSMFTIDSYAKIDCFTQIQETTRQAVNMFAHSLEQSRTHLTLFADILAANSSNSDDLLKVYMETFCKVQNFSAVCIHRPDGTTLWQGFHPHETADAPSFASEVKKVPYISDVYSAGESRKDRYIYLAVPIVRKDNVVGILYGYISLDRFPSFVSSAEYEGSCRFYIVNGDDGSLLMDEYHRYDQLQNERPLGNVFDDSMGAHETKPGYDLEEMRRRMKSGESGFFIFKYQNTGEWYYTHYTPVGINNWSMQLTIAESTAFTTYYSVKNTVFILMVCMTVLSAAVLGAFLWQHKQASAADKARMQKSEYVSEVQRTLISAHNNPDFVHQALQIICRESQAETVLLLTLSENKISSAYYSPVQDKSAAMMLIGMDVREAFPVIYESLTAGKSFFGCQERFSDQARRLLEALNVSNMLLVPIKDNTGGLKAAIAAINIPPESNRPELLECLTHDFFLAITNLESFSIIKNMGTVDYLTGVKNRNAYQTELGSFVTLRASSLWCMYVDVNGLHETNNTKGHEAGDLMLAAVAKVMKKVIDSEWVYRLGGDEFVAFVKDSTHEDLMSYKHRIMDELAQMGYFVSVGFEGTAKNDNRVFEVERIVKRAEEIMYKEKKEYYEKNRLSNDRGHLITVGEHTSGEQN